MPEKMGRKNWSSKKGQGHHKKSHRMGEPGLIRGSMRLTHQGAFMGLT